MTAFNDRENMIGALVRAMPYIQRYRGKTFVIQVDGPFCADTAAQREVAEQVAVIRGLGIRVVMVHGPGPQVDYLADRLNLGGRFVDGQRVTDDVALDLQMMVCAGMTNVGMLSAFRGAGVPTVGITGIDAGLITARQRPMQPQTNLAPEQDLIGEVTGVDTKVLETLLEGGLMPLVCPLSADPHGQVLSLEAGEVSAAIAGAMNAEKLIILTEKRGLCENPEDPESVISYLDLDGLEALKMRRFIDGIMRRRTDAAAQALQAGVKRVHLVGYSPFGTLLGEIFTSEGTGTLMVADATQPLD